VRRFGEHCLAVFLHERLNDQIVRIALGDPLIDFFQHAEGGIARARECAAGVITAPGGIVAAAAHASHFHADDVRVISRLPGSKCRQQWNHAPKT
jgi:beta-glucosidase-like glycosyl hydrolase